MRMLLGIAVLVTGLAPIAAKGTEIGTIRTRDHAVRILAGEPPRYTVLDREGRVVAGRATLEEIARRFPDVHRALTEGLAGAQDARLR